MFLIIFIRAIIYRGRIPFDHFSFVSYMQVQAVCQSLSQKYLRRRHKLYKALSSNSTHHELEDFNQQIQHQGICQQDKKIINVFDKTQKQVFCRFAEELYAHNQNSSFDGSLFCAFIMSNIQDNKSVWLKYSKVFLQFLEDFVVIRSGQLIAYIFYRICRKNKNFFDKILKYLQKRVIQQFQIQNQYEGKLCLNKIAFWTDLYLYGFPITSEFFIENIFPRFKEDIIELSIKYQQIFERNDIFNRKNKYHIRISKQQWLQQKVQAHKKSFLKLESLKNIIQQKQIDELQNSEESDRYLQLFEIYQEKKYKLIHLGYQIKQEPFQLNDIKKQCEFYNKKYQLSPLLQQLYRNHHLKLVQISKKKSNKHQKLLQDEVFLLQIRKCCTVQQAVNLSGYFLQQLNNQANRQNLVEYIIDYCHSQSNIDLLTKILYEISQNEPSLKLYLSKKGEIISNQIKMNKKYVNFLTQCIKFDLIKSDILLKYMERRIHQESQSVPIIIKEIQLIIECLGPSIYHQSLKTNIRINQILDYLEVLVRSKQQMNIQISFGLKCLKNYLRVQKCKATNFQEKDQLHSLNVKQNFNFLLRKIQQILNQGKNSKHKDQQKQQNKNLQRVTKYFIDAISAQTYMNTYYYASLIKQVKNKKLMQMILQKTISMIVENIDDNIQTAVCWSRFLGELYNYEIINRKRMIQILNSFLEKAFLDKDKRRQNQCLDFQKLLKCLIQCLNVSKIYILESENSKKSNSLTSQQHVINFLIQLKKILLNYGSLNNYLIQNQFFDILQYFHPVLIKKLTTIQEISEFQQKMMNLAFTNSFSINGNKSSFVNVYECLSIYGQIDDTINFDSKIISSRKCIIQNNSTSPNINKETNDSKNIIKSSSKIDENQSKEKQQLNKQKKVVYKQKPVKKYMQKQKKYMQKIQSQSSNIQLNSQIDQMFARSNESQEQEKFQQNLQNTYMIDTSLVAKESKQIQEELESLQFKAKIFSQQKSSQYPQEQLIRGKKSQNLNIETHLSHHKKNGVRVLVKQPNQKTKQKKY